MRFLQTNHLSATPLSSSQRERTLWAQFRTLTRSSVLHCGLALLLSSGCANLQEKRTITAFQEGLEAGDLTVLREGASHDFQQKALRHPDANDSLTQLRIPDEEFKILHIEDVTETEKKVTIGFGEEGKRKIQYLLVKQGADKKWKVDDIYLRQRSGGKTITMPVTSQMDVLISAREFYEAWSEGDRAVVLAHCGPELAQPLSELPPSILAATITRMMGQKNRESNFRPEAHISGDRAVVKLNRAHGKLLMSMEKRDEAWVVKDLALESREEARHVNSLIKTAQITNQAFAFLEAWDGNNKPKLKELTEETFYAAGLAPANLNDLKLPTLVEIDPDLEVKLFEKRADVILKSDKQTLRMTMQEPENELDPYQIAEVTVYDLAQDQTLSVTSALTARPVAELFLNALATRDQKMLQFSSTRDFHQLTWERAGDQTIKIVPLPVPDMTQARILDTQYLGTVTHIQVEANGQPMTVVLHDQNGRVLVDDLLITDPLTIAKTGQSSLKEYLMATIPVYELAAQIHHDRPAQTIRLVTDDYYDRVFSITSHMPDSANAYLDHISNQTPLVEILSKNSTDRVATEPLQEGKVARYVSDDGAVMVTFNSKAGKMRVSLRYEQGMLRVDDAFLFGADNQVADRLKQTMRMDLAAKRTKNMIQTVSGEIRMLNESEASSTISPSQNRIQTAHYETPAEPQASPVNAPSYQKVSTQIPATPSTPPAQPQMLKDIDCSDHLLCQPIPIP